MTDSTPPLVSVVVCTRDRQEMLVRALRSVLHQEGSSAEYEVIVVDDGTDPPALIPSAYADRVRLVRIPRQGVGAARSAGLAAARGTFVAYCDDDDEWTPNHLSILLAYLRAHEEVDLVYADSLWSHDGVEPHLAYSFDYNVFELAKANYIFASDVMHRASAAREVGGFDPSLQVYEDWDLWLRISQAHVVRHLPVVVGYHRWHAGALLADHQWEQWERVRRAHQERQAQEGIAPGHRPSRGAGRVVPFDPRTWREGRKELIWHSVVRPAGTGYGTGARQLLLAVERQGVDVVMAPFGNQPAAGLERFYKRFDHLGCLAFYYDFTLQLSALECERIVPCFMWESTGVPREKTDEINRGAAMLFVPCRQNLDAFRDCGVRVDIKVLHHAVGEAEFPYLQRSRREVFTFGSYGDFTVRKGMDLLVRAFQDEFAPEEPVRLLLKSSAQPPALLIRDPRVELASGYVSHQSLLELLREMDVFVLPSRGEGFGLCGIEAMSTGLPLIATDWGGPVEYMHPDDSFPLSYRLVDAGGAECHGVPYFGEWAEPDYEHLRYLMRWLYGHPEEAARRGKAAAERIHRGWTWDRAAKQLCDGLDEVAQR